MAHRPISGCEAVSPDPLKGPGIQSQRDHSQHATQGTAGVNVTGTCPTPKFPPLGICFENGK